jgi:8-oxo-dGTP pyrophosphatase MutT (NUDIX family)
MLYLVRQYRHAVGGELVEVVAGTLEDESPRECALRELEEGGRVSGLGAC